MQTTTTVVGGAASVGNALVGTTSGIVGNASKVAAQGINHLKPDVVATDITHVLSGGTKIAADQATSITTAGVHGVAVIADGTTQTVVGGLSLVKNSPTAVKENISHLVTGEHAITPAHLVPDIAKDAIHTVVGDTSIITGTPVGASTKAAVTGETFQCPGQCKPVACQQYAQGAPGLSSTCHSTIPTSEPPVPDNANGPIQAVVGEAHAVVGVVAQPVVKPLAAIGAAKAATTENVTKVANALDSVNPLRPNGLSKGSMCPNPIGGLLHLKLPGLIS
ncbi:hypothetical protein BJV77DRAFT_1029951 [Russula vinacea]|nr:hypothetical protein BJV77DRAFT_1029951 [Russula vinacea]